MSFFRQFPKTTYDFSNNGIDTTIVDLFRFIKAEDVYQDDLSAYTYYQVKNGDRPDVVSSVLYGTPDYYWTFFILNEHLKTGISGWPMSTEMFETYIQQEYDGIVIITKPKINRDGTNTVLSITNSLVDRFDINDIVRGSKFGATGRVAKKDVQLSQLVLKDVVGIFASKEEDIVEQTQQSDADSVDIVTSHKVLPYAYAPHHYETVDGLESYNSLFINEQFLYTPTGTQIDNSGNLDSRVSDSYLNPVSNYEYEQQLNDDRANLRVVRPEHIYDFVKTFKEKINA